MKIAVVGGGAAGLVAAGSAKGAEVVLFEHKDKVGRKIYITGKGRCNFTNVCDVPTFLQNVVTNDRFLRGALYRFTPDDAVALLENNGCKTKVERGRRAFPLSDKASDVTKALTKYAADNGTAFRTDAKISSVKKDGERFIVISDYGAESFDKVIMCTGGVSYPATGSDGSAHKIIQALGHTIVKPYPSLVALYCDEDLSKARGLTLKHVSVSCDGVKPIFGDMLITDSGVSGPIILTLSAYTAKRSFPYIISVDFKPSLPIDELDDRIIKDFEAQKNKQFKNSLDLLLPKSIIPYIIDRSGIDPEKRVNSVTKAERRNLILAIKEFTLTVVGNEGFEHAVVTQGGVDVKEVDPKTMESKLVNGLYFGGEVLDVDALTGGYNFHIALATGFIAGSSAVGNNG
ncbi:MAG: NAD(P)/FAD-dependent oxidoreductase [Clostridiales bacterium]|nr:NAD(P)/FAD-dependent oxidoreductase [Clostridiales bacterium]